MNKSIALVLAITLSIIRMSSGPKIDKKILQKKVKGFFIRFLKMMKDPYGNYVAQKLYGSVDDNGRRDFNNKLSLPEVVSELRKDNYG